MSVDLGTRLVREELVSRADLERALSHAASHGRTLPHALVELGLLGEDALSSFFRARLPFGEVGRSSLSEVSAAVATAMPREMSEQFGALVIGRVEDTLTVAMVDPSNAHAIAEVGFFTGCRVLPLVVRPSDVDWARERLYPPAPADADLREAVVELVTKRTPHPDPVSRGAVPGRVGRRPTEALVELSAALGPEADVPTLLARIHRSTDRDEVIALAVVAAARACRRAALFVIKKAVAQGWDAKGEGVVAGAIRNVWIPVSSPSVLRIAATTLEPYVGPVDDTIANGILMAALGRRVDRVGVWPVVVRERAIAVLYADGFGAEALARVDEVVHELALAFERIILEEKARR